MARILSLDQSTTRSGYAIFVDGKYDHSGLIDKHKNKDINSRFKEMYEGIHEVIEAEKPDIVVLEDTQAQGGNFGTYKILCQLQGAIIGMCYAMDIGFHVLTPSQWRATLQFRQGPNVKRDELKVQSIAFAKKEFGIDEYEDQMEAVCIGEAFHRMISKDIDIEI